MMLSISGLITVLKASVNVLPRGSTLVMVFILTCCDEVLEVF